MVNKVPLIRIIFLLFIILGFVVPAIYLGLSPIWSIVVTVIGLTIATIQALRPLQEMLESGLIGLEKAVIREFQKLWRKKSWKNTFFLLLVSLLAISIVCNLLQWYSLHASTPAPACSTTPICVFTRTEDNTTVYLGINDGTQIPYFNQFDQAPDPQSTDGTEAQITEAQLERDIYKANQDIVGKPHITLVLVTTLSRTVTDPNASLTGGMNDLRGAYIAQKYYNADNSHTTKLRLLIANMGTRSVAVRTAPDLVKQIEQLATSKSDSTFVGVVGFPFSKSAKAALDSFKDHDIPIVSTSASSNLLSHIPNFYRIISPDGVQSEVIQKFITSRLPANIQMKCTAVFIDNSNPPDPFSTTLGNGVINSGIPNPRTENYNEGVPASLISKVDDVLNAGCGMIFFAGFPEDLSVLKDTLKDKMEQRHLTQDILIMGGGALYNLGGYNTRDNYKNLFFTANATYAYPNPNAVDPNFRNEYHESFDPQGQYTGKYGAGLPEVQAILSFDAIYTFLDALARVPNKQSPSLKDLSDALPSVSFDGVSGHISLVNGSTSTSPNSDPVNKYVYMACTDSNAQTQIIATYQFVNNQLTEVGDGFHLDAFNKCRQQANGGS